VTLAVSIAAALCADPDLVLSEVARQPSARAAPPVWCPGRTHVQCASSLRLDSRRGVSAGRPVPPRVNPIAAGWREPQGMSVSRFLPGAAVSAAVWAGIWIGIRYLADSRVAGLAGVSAFR